MTASVILANGYEVRFSNTQDGKVHVRLYDADGNIISETTEDRYDFRRGLLLVGAV